jgi:hypothetical protein
MLAGGIEINDIVMGITVMRIAIIEDNNKDH